MKGKGEGLVARKRPVSKEVGLVAGSREGETAIAKGDREGDNLSIS